MKRKQSVISSISPEEFAESVPHPWRFLPHTFASFISERKWIPFEYLVLISHLITQAIAAGNGRILISLPPRHGKSHFISQYLPAWFIANWPEKKVILATYEANFAASWGKKTRDVVAMCEPYFDNLSLSSDLIAASRWETTLGGGMFTAGAQGPLTGKGGDLILCFPEGTLVTLENGSEIDISKINNHHVLSYDHEFDMVVKNRVTTTRRWLDGDFIEITTRSGCKIRPTREHHIYDCQSGYKPACDFKPGDRIYVLTKVSQKQDLSNLQPIQDNARCDALGMLQQSKKDNNYPILRKMWQSFRATTIRVREDAQAWACRCVLQFKVQSRRSCDEKQSAVSGVWKIDGSRKKILLQRLSSGKSTANGEMCRRGMLKRISFQIYQANILFSRLRKQGARQAYAWLRKFAFYPFIVLEQLFQADAFFNLGTGREEMCSMWSRGTGVCNASRTQEKQYCNPSYQRTSLGEPAGEPCQSLCNASPTSAQVQEDEVVSVRELRSKREYVYDIRVEGSRNFFAGGILVHNCDDPHKNWQEAMSKSICDGIYDWFKSTLYTRAEPGATICILHTRWSTFDLIGRLLQEDDSDNWFEIRFPALAEEDDPLGRALDVPLCPERFSYSDLIRIRTSLGSQKWAGLYQQRPSPEKGIIVQRGWWQHYRVPPAVIYVVQSWDTGFKKTMGSAYSSCQTWGYAPTHGFVLLDRWRDRVEWPELLRQAKAQYYSHKPNAVLIEDKASGQSLLQDLTRNTTIPVIPVEPIADKELRYRAVSPLIEAGRGWLPVPSIDCPWIGGFEEDSVNFPSIPYSDDIDAMSQALMHLSQFSDGLRIVGGGMKRRTSTLFSDNQFGGFRALLNRR